MATAEVPGPQSIIRFDSFELDSGRRTISRDGIRLKIQKQPLQVLELLISRAPAIVSADEIRRHVWGDDVYIDAGQSIRFCIRQIRSVLNDNSAAARFVETLPKQGYRFIASLEGGSDMTSIAENPPAPASGQRRTKSRSLILIVGTLAAFVVGVGSWNTYVRKDTISGVARLTPITTYAGDEREPSLSPDGHKVVFSWDGENGGPRHIYIALLGEAHPIQLTDGPARDGYPAWSPDGNYAAFVRWRTTSEGEIILIPSIGGSERKLRTVPFGWIALNSERLLAWTPDNKSLCFTSRVGSSGNRLFLLSLQTGVVRRLTAWDDAYLGDSSPAFSPDGHWLAFTRLRHMQVSSLLLQRLTSNFEPEGKPLVVEGAGMNPRTPVWTPNGKKLLFRDGSRIMQTEIGSPARLFYAANLELQGLTSAAQSTRLAAAQHNEDADIWVMPLEKSGLAAAARPRSILRSTARDAMPTYSPDGRWLAFSSWRTGSSEIWLADSTGQNARQLTRLDAYLAFFPRWSPNGRFLAFYARAPYIGQIYITGVEDGVTRQITHDPFDSLIPTWSTDGKTLYLGQNRGGKTQIYSMPAWGGPPHLMWGDLSGFPMEAPARRLLLYTKPGEFGVFARSLVGDPATNPEQKLVNDYISPNGGISLFSDGFYYTSFTEDGSAQGFRFYSFASGKTVDVAPFHGNLDRGMSVSPDRKRLAYAAFANGNEDLVEIELN